MTAEIRTHVSLPLSFLKREIQLIHNSQFLTDKDQYTKLYPPLFYVDSNITCVHVFTEREKTDLCVEREASIGENILFDHEKPARVIFEDRFLFLKRITTVTHQVPAQFESSS